ncbi:YhgE/Pip domain-containing protein [Cohnella nanjingensis]|uniref:DUF3533 domain-containing protein n=1 Tax=Cohnella nanjingensis TaxID=1387779 RepID=A0A7X0RKX5_9BACL|nr:ABC transporter permease [Cohnella nanjingensis]MBB6669246.1 DUF3533 domain-containing protein [Cohnella nanjingensis]
MTTKSSFFEQKQVWIGAVAALSVAAVIGLAILGTTMRAQLQSFPVALVVLDEPTRESNEGQSTLGEIIKTQMIRQSELPIAWKALGSMAEVLKGLDRQDYYAALIIPYNPTRESSGSKSAAIQILINEGKNPQVASTVQWLIYNALQSMTADSMIAPVPITVKTVHPIGHNQANGNAPTSLTEIAWIDSLATSVALFLASQQALKKNGRRVYVVFAQLATGIVFVLGTSAFLLWMLTVWYGMEVSNWNHLWLFLLFSSFVFFLLQTALLNWIGLPALPLMVLLLFFSMPILSIAPEMLPRAAHDWLYSWTPLRYVQSGLRTVMYFDGNQMNGVYKVLAWLTGICLVLATASVYKPFKASKSPKKSK